MSYFFSSMQDNATRIHNIQRLSFVVLFSGSHGNKDFRNKMADVLVLRRERLTKLSRSSVSNVTETLLDPNPELFKRIVKQERWA